MRKSTSTSTESRHQQAQKVDINKHRKLTSTSTQLFSVNIYTPVGKDVYRLIFMWYSKFWLTVYELQEKLSRKVISDLMSDFRHFIFQVWPNLWNRVNCQCIMAKHSCFLESFVVVVNSNKRVWSRGYKTDIINQLFYANVCSRRFFVSENLTLQRVLFSYLWKKNVM